MINIDKIEVFNFEGALRGLRNPLESWDKSDSFWEYENVRDNKGIYVLGEKDLNLAQRMVHAGSDEAKFMRQISVSMDIIAPLYWWKEMDTYKVGTVANSCSTMHKLATTPITKDCFSFDAVEEDYKCFGCGIDFPMVEGVCNILETYRLSYLKTKDKRYWRALIQLLPESWNQKRTWTANYQTLRAIYFARRSHKLVEWHEFCRMIEKLPYGKELICY